MYSCSTHVVVFSTLHRRSTVENLETRTKSFGGWTAAVNIANANLFGIDGRLFIRSIPHRTHHGPDEGEGAAGGGEAAEDGEEGQLAAEVAEQRPRGPGQRERDADRGHGGGELGVDVGQGDILRILLQEEEHEARIQLAVLLELRHFKDITISHISSHLVTFWPYRFRLYFRSFP